MPVARECVAREFRRVLRTTYSAILRARSASVPLGTFPRRSVRALSTRLHTADDVLGFWFGARPTPPSTLPYIEANWPRWFAGADARFDVAQAANAPLVHAAGNGALDAVWGGDSDAAGVLARILLVDQFARCAFSFVATADMDFNSSPRQPTPIQFKAKRRARARISRRDRSATHARL